MNISFHIVKLVLMLLLTFLVASISTGMFIDAVKIQDLRLVYGFQFAATLVLFEAGLWIFNEKSIIKEFASNFDFRKYIFGFWVGIGLIALSQMYSILFDNKEFTAFNFWVLPSMILLFAFQTLVEELMFRRFFLNQFIKIQGLNRLFSVLFSAVIFAFMHIFGNQIWIDTFNLFLFGLFLAMVYIYIEQRHPKQGLSWTAGFHFGWNLTYFLIGLNYTQYSKVEAELGQYGLIHIQGSDTSFWVNKIAISLVLGCGIWWMMKREAGKIDRLLSAT